MIEGADHEGDVLTVVEGKVGRTFMHAIENTSAEEVMTAAMRPFAGRIRAITADNGKEFARDGTIAAIPRTRLFSPVRARHGSAGATKTPTASSASIWQRAAA